MESGKAADSAGLVETSELEALFPCSYKIADGTCNPMLGSVQPVILLAKTLAAWRKHQPNYYCQAATARGHTPIGMHTHMVHWLPAWASSFTQSSCGRTAA
eukprot:5252657-Amphidinium_carterae.1